LKVHADEYIDKRAMSDEEVVAKVDYLVGLSGFPAGAPPMPRTEELEVGDLDMMDVVEDSSLASAALGDGGDDDGDDGRSAVPEQIAHEGGVEFDPRELGADEDDDGSFEFSEPMHAGNDAPVPMAPVHATGTGRARDRRAERRESAPQAAPTSPDVDPGFEGPDLSDMGEFEADRTAVISPFPLVFDSAGQLDVAEPVAPMAAAHEGESVPEDEGGIEPSAPVADLDLGLDQVASLAAEEQLGGDERHHQLRAAELEREVERLREELEQARREAPAGGTPFSREREFLNLREVINKKEKLILDLNDQLDGKDGQVLAAKEKTRELDRIRSDLDAKNLELEQSLLGANEELAGLRGERKSLSEQLRRQTDNLTSLRADADQLSRLLERERAQWREERESLVRKHGSEIDQLKQEMDGERARAEEMLREKHGGDLRSLKEAYEETSAEKDRGFGAALALAEVRRQEELTAAQRGAEERLQLELAEQRRRLQDDMEGVRREYAAELNSLRQDHAGEVETLTRQNREGLQAMEERHREQLARAEDEHRQALQSAEARRASEVSEAERRRASEAAAAEERRARELADAGEERARAEAELRDRHESAQSAMEREHGEVRRDLESRRAGLEQDLRERTEDLSRAQATLRAREENIASLNAVLNERDARIAALRQEGEELERQNAGYQEQVLRAFQKIRADEATVARAKKAMAIALTLLDDAEQAAAVESAVSSDD
ncbi:MAG TPA: hypothetical protein VKB80_29625, partial [Kofleriaceae bacterium]|nr:hypothetical protein [Kofleriaceae bacterium]